MKLMIFRSKAFFFSIIVMLSAALISGCQERASEEPAEVVEEAHHDVEPSADDPWAVDIEELTVGNENYRSAVWTGKYIQLALMTLQPGERIDPELHDNHDQFIRIEEGEAQVLMGKEKDNMTFDKIVGDDWAILIPAGYWHEVINTGDTELKLYTVYGPPEHKPRTLHKTYAEAEHDHHDHDH